MLKKDIWTLCLLHLLTKQDCYGYDLLRQLHNLFMGTQESVLYALLRDLCKAGLTKTYLQESPNGPARKYYQITDAGKERLQELMEQWQQLKNALLEIGID